MYGIEHLRELVERYGAQHGTCAAALQMRSRAPQSIFKPRQKLKGCVFPIPASISYFGRSGHMEAPFMRRSPGGVRFLMSYPFCTSAMQV